MTTPPIEQKIVFGQRFLTQHEFDTLDSKKSDILYGIKRFAPPTGFIWMKSPFSQYPADQGWYINNDGLTGLAFNILTGQQASFPTARIKFSIPNKYRNTITEHIVRCTDPFPSFPSISSDWVSSGMMFRGWFDSVETGKGKRYEDSSDSGLIPNKSVTLYPQKMYDFVPNLPVGTVRVDKSSVWPGYKAWIRTSSGWKECTCRGEVSTGAKSGEGSLLIQRGSTDVVYHRSTEGLELSANYVETDEYLTKFSWYQFTASTGKYAGASAASITMTSLYDYIQICPAETYTRLYIRNGNLHESGQYDDFYFGIANAGRVFVLPVTSKIARSGGDIVIKSSYTSNKEFSRTVLAPSAEIDPSVDEKYELDSATWRSIGVGVYGESGIVSTYRTTAIYDTDFRTDAYVFT